MTSLDQNQEPTIHFLSRLAGQNSRVIRTSISVVVLGDTIAYKLKQSLRLPYLDFSTPDARFEMCQRELAFNQAYAKDLYLGTHRITRKDDGSLTLDGDGPLVDAVVAMHRFGDTDSFQFLANNGKLTRQLLEQLVHTISAAHDLANPSSDYGGYKCMKKELNDVFTALEQNVPQIAAQLADAHNVLTGLLNKDQKLLDQRKAAGKVRHCHGDLALRNICLFNGKPTAFDCIEFSDEIATIDILYDIAYLIIDLWRSDLKDLANYTFNRYLDIREESDGLSLMPYFLSFRAIVRGHADALQGDTDLAESYFRTANDVPKSPTGVLIAIGGYSGCGKSTLADLIAVSISAPPGARLINTDRIRKDMYMQALEARLPKDAYLPEVSSKVYETLYAEAEKALSAGWAVIVDGVFDRKEDQARIEQVAHKLNIPFQGVWLETDLKTRIDRIESRACKISDATDKTAREQELNLGSLTTHWHKLDAAQPLSEILQQVLQLLGRMHTTPLQN
ncbi:MAG: AAA family ATPase [Fluviibacter sp.]